MTVLILDAVWKYRGIAASHEEVAGIWIFISSVFYVPFGYFKRQSFSRSLFLR